MKNITLLFFIIAFFYYVPEIIYKFILDLFSNKRTFTCNGYNLIIEFFSVSCENIYVTIVKMNKCVKGKLKEKTPINNEIKIMRTLINHDDDGIEVLAINIQMSLVKTKN